MRIDRWTIERGERPHSFVVTWTHPTEGWDVASFPVLRDFVRLPWLWYPYVLLSSVRAIEQVKRARFLWGPFADPDENEPAYVVSHE